MARSGIKVRLVKDSDAKGTAQVLPHRGQRYEELKRQCLQKKILFSDPEFKPIDDSLGPPESEERRVSKKWMRPKEICKPSLPHFIEDGMIRFDVIQTDLGNCWFMSAVASLTLHQELLRKVVPPDQGFDDEDYAGIFHFQFWQYGKWVDVVVDDLLPTVGGNLYFGQSSSKDEFWMPLLEKAYAKLNGSYEALIAGSMNEAFVDFTGGIGETILLKQENSPLELFEKIQEALSRKSLMAAGISKDKNVPNNLASGHAYSITGIHELHLEGREVKLVRLRNPWGHKEWTGSWSDKSSMWSKLDSAQREKLHVIEEDGEFWMLLGDFKKYFDSLCICHLSANAPREEAVPFSWKCSIFHGSWVKGLGECRAHDCYVDTLMKNPHQYFISLPEADDAEKKNQGQYSESTLLVSLMQKDQRRKHPERHQIARRFLNIKVNIIEVSETYPQQKSMDKRRQLSQNLGRIETLFIAAREFTRWFHLPPGNYVIIPMVFEQLKDITDFTIRIFTKKQHKFLKIDGEISAEEKTLQVTRPFTRGVNRILYKYFMKEAGKDRQISVAELQKILNEIIDIAMNKEFSLEVCQKIIQHFSAQGTDRLTLGEFKQLWGKIIEWERIFTNYDFSMSGSITNYRIPEALEDAGFSLNKRTIEVLEKKFSGTYPHVDFDDFVCFVMHLERVFRRCKRRDINGDGVIYLTEKEWMDVATQLEPEEVTLPF